MSDGKEQQRPRKILGMNSRLTASIHQADLNSIGIIENLKSTVTSMDRMRFSNMNQDIPSLWPYGAFISPVLPAPNMALPYSMTPGLPYTAVPFFQTISGASTSNGSQQHQHNINSREPSKMTIQIGLQCVNQNNPLNINSMNDMGTSVGNISLQMDESDKEKNDGTVLGTSPMNSKAQKKEQSDHKNGSSYLGGGEPSDFVINMATFEILKNLALSGSETAEKLAYTHRNRPCFKKIDSLCARLKQDLVRPDGVLPNINSQGIAWAVKDFIFVFTRVMNAWIIIKGYVYNTPEGLNKVRSALSPEFERSFAAWQDTTVNFIDNLIKSFVNLDNLVQSQKNVYQKVNSLTSTKSIHEDCLDISNSSIDENCVPKDLTSNNNYMYTMVEDSELTQRENTLNGTYFKTGTYNFIKRESSDDNAIGIDQLFDENFVKSLSNIYNLLPTFKAQRENNLNCDIRVLENKLSEFSSGYDPNLEKPLGKDLVNKLNLIMDRLMNMQNADLFFKAQFCKNYFPDFMKNTPDFMDVRGIILKCQTGAYGHVFEVVHDIRLIIYQAKTYLKTHVDEQLATAINSFQGEIETIFAQEPFENYNFDHIKGVPNEILYNVGK